MSWFSGPMSVGCVVEEIGRAKGMRVFDEKSKGIPERQFVINSLQYSSHFS